ncbi:MAG: hypothetical protein JNL44_11075 [Gemmatimonadetes bacterium]|nr:hypothetical protein [Gemmatimonadota bacterium]
MRLDLSERLRCPSAHQPTPLVIVADEVLERDLVRGTAGCPVCRAEVRIARGDLWFEDAAAPAGTRVEGGAGAGTGVAPSHDIAGLERLMALLGLSEPGGAILLTGGYARFALPLAATLDFSVVTFADRGEGPAPGDGHERGFALAAVRGAPSAVPFSDGTFRAAALDAGLGPALVQDALRCTVPGGRVVAPVALPRPDGVQELARDGREWVGETVPAAPMVTLGRRS